MHLPPNEKFHLHIRGYYYHYQCNVNECRIKESDPSVVIDRQSQSSACSTDKLRQAPTGLPGYLQHHPVIEQ